ncbi:MAG: hypothetical protein R3C18_12620 [Planctomycetaceae bacterium]
MRSGNVLMIGNMQIEVSAGEEVAVARTALSRQLRKAALLWGIMASMGI